MRIMGHCSKCGNIIISNSIECTFCEYNALVS